MKAMNPGGHDPADLYRLLVRACEAAGLDPRSAELLRGQTNAVFRLASVAVLTKVARYGTPVARVRGTVELVSWLMDIGFRRHRSILCSSSNRWWWTGRR